MSRLPKTNMKDTNWRASEVVCANQMMQIADGHFPLRQDTYVVAEVASRYGVSRDAVYRGVSANSPLYPEPTRLGSGPKATMYFTSDALEACDSRRIAFYRTTPSWRKFLGLEHEKPPKRIAARALLGTVK